MSRLQRFADSRWFGWLAAFALLLLSRPFQGVRHDGRLYVADALAKLDPQGVGKDLLFVHDGQFGFSLYTPLLARLIDGLGISGGTLAVVFLTLVLWFAALVLLSLKWLYPLSKMHKTPETRKELDDKKHPPFWNRLVLVLSAMAVSFVHGSNDGQKGIGLIMLVLISIVLSGITTYMAVQARLHVGDVVYFKDMENS